jgi:hypothetical protein
MIRQQRRFEQREAIKELAKMKKYRNYKTIMDGSFLAGQMAEDIELLKEGVHPNEKLQNEFKFNVAFVKTVLKLEAKIELLGNNKENDRSFKQNQVFAV